MKVLNVAEKPSVAKEIANILSSGRAQRVWRARILLLVLLYQRLTFVVRRWSALIGASASRFLAIQCHLRVSVRDPGPERADGRDLRDRTPHGARL